MLIHLSIQGHTNVKHSNLNGEESWFNFTFMSCILKTITNLPSVRMNIKLKSQLMNYSEMTNINHVQFTTIK